jgi:adenosylhomocysteine nucleosidase
MKGPLGLVAALPEELDAVMADMACTQHVQRAGRRFHVGQLHGHPVVAVLARVGKVAAATTATTLIEHFGVRALVFTGVAGGLADGVRVGDVVVAQSLLQHDMDASPLFPRYEVPLTGTTHWPCDPQWVQALAQAAHAIVSASAPGPGAGPGPGPGLARVHNGLVVSGDRFVSTAAESAALRLALPQALAVEMEGAAVAQVCADYGVPVGMVRFISDRADDTAHHDFSAFVAHVARPASVQLIRHLLQHL